MVVLSDRRESCELTPVAQALPHRLSIFRCRLFMLMWVKVAAYRLKSREKPLGSEDLNCPMRLSRVRVGRCEFSALEMYTRNQKMPLEFDWSNV